MLINLFSDGTCVQKFGNLSFHPIFLTLGNIDAEERRKDLAHRLVGFIPAIEGSESERKKENFKQAKRLIFQACIETLMKTFETQSRE